MIRKIMLLTLMIFVLFIGTEVIAADSIGTVIAVQGRAYATNEAGAVTRSLERHSEFYLREVIATKGSGVAQLRLKDGTIISLKQNTRYSVSEFNLDPKNPRNNRYVGKLIDGVILSLSGQGRNSTYSNHILRTPAVTISARGILYEAGLKAKALDQKKGTRGKGLVGWVYVADGKLKVATRKGSFDINARDSSNNSCVYLAVGSKVGINRMSEKQMRWLVARYLGASDLGSKIYGAMSNAPISGLLPAIPGAERDVQGARTVVGDFQLPESKPAPGSVGYYSSPVAPVVPPTPPSPDPGPVAPVVGK
jgi:hypothetical protein